MSSRMSFLWRENPDILFVSKESWTTGSRNRVVEVVQTYIPSSTTPPIEEKGDAWEIEIPPSTSEVGACCN